MNPKRFLTAGGAILVALGVLGVTGLLGKISSASFFHPPDWIDWFHLFFGLIVLGSGLFGRSRWQTGLTLFGTVMGTALGLAGLILGPYAAARFGQPALADVSDHIVHLFVGLFAAWGYRGRPKPAIPPQPPSPGA